MKGPWKKSVSAQGTFIRHKDCKDPIHVQGEWIIWRKTPYPSIRKAKFAIIKSLQTEV